MLSIPADLIISPVCRVESGKNNISVAMLRADLIHPLLSGNKLFKLHYFLEACLATPAKTLLTFGGAYSNHLIASAFACREKNIRSIGIVRGEEPAPLSHTLRRCRELGMVLHFIPREKYRLLSQKPAAADWEPQFGDCTIVPEGGFSPKGAAGAALISNIANRYDPSHICVPVGTAVTLAGLLMMRKPDQEIIGVPVLKNMTDIEARIKTLVGDAAEPAAIFRDYEFGGYAKSTEGLIAFMNSFFHDNGVPLDFVYTAKMMFAVVDQIRQGYFKAGSRVLCIHTGGLQGNESLPAGALTF